MLGDIKCLRACIVNYKGRNEFAIQKDDLFYIEDKKRPFSVKSINKSSVKEYCLCQYNNHHEKLIIFIFMKVKG